MSVEREDAKAWRLKNDLTQEQVAEIIGSTANAYTLWEIGRSKSMRGKKLERLKTLIDGRSGQKQPGDHEPGENMWSVVTARLEGLCALLRSGAGDDEKGRAFSFEVGFLVSLAERAGIIKTVDVKE